MTTIEEHVTDLLTRIADDVDVRPDLERVRGEAAASSLTGGAGDDRARPRPRGRHRRPLAVAIVAAAACASIGTLVVTAEDPPGTVDVQTPPSPPTSAGADGIDVPRFLVSAPGWEVMHVEESSGEEFGGHVGEATLGNGDGYSILLHWYPAAQLDDFIADRTAGTGPPTPTTIDGHDALLFDGERTIEIWWRVGGTVFDLRGDNFPSLDDYLAVAASVRGVDQQTWLAALPAGIVRPDDRPGVVDAVLAELPVPRGLDVDALSATGTANDARHIEHEVTDAVVCAWVQQWVDATRTGDAEAVDEAVEAMVSSREWPPLVEAAGGPWTTYIWDVADAMAADVPLEQYPGVEQGAAYQRHLGCPETGGTQQD